ncbi:hypothetical protein [Palleronia sp.]|uniref:hypothetical protein n=1 Tax=Palleronia sp. TaxID=1940284 RepID=UPI0035C7C0F6
MSMIQNQDATRTLKTWTDVDVDAFCQVAPEAVVRMLKIGLETAVRPKDLVELEDIAVLEDEVGGTSWLRFTSSKKNRRRHRLPAGPATREAMREVEAGRPMIANSRGERITSGTLVVKLVNAWRARASLDAGLGYMAARRTAVARWSAEGMSDGEIARRLGRS